ncbi:MAG TPA: glutamine--fructose-6-phosphate transaminase (isomerizing) [Clostridiaceae bacterium]|jgi:glucosamine--fructose-6-phosphate aminotransferase (isomerizing)|nr:glutamine--fructose-6-phosphate transaminase (isomerizing) [Clostridia bacterium]CDC07086.1 glucosamine--fructose-6-phosphate aminotransferase [isomerizing] [Clostridium sp. CAG:343]HCF34034.1 glutamine--fructose-6-phosphate transaminase (isomerizing) [Clostridiales bacterium]HJJ19216.1 glutamine--fructose-6-phosphate transaminase (isomerizing) [Clostridiaceae bacterium]MBP8633697.1 glutamine--fructose-6-phosphate transaminase (isomerizing) [Clostridia bacterium]
MCGIVGYIGTKKASPILINGLLRLEYRGYDSAGISTIEKDGLSIMKDKGRVKNLNNLPGIDDLEGTIGIAHTRWATHGKPSKENSHPHMDNSKTFSVVHNGIIENYNELRKFLINNGYTFYSQTDTEIIPNLIHYYYSKDDNNDSFRFLRAVKNACSDLKGSFALEIICKNDPNNMIVVRKDSPLVIGKGNGENYISSDIPAILSFTREFYLLEDLEFVVLSRDDAKFYDKNLNPIDKKIQTIEWNASSAEKDGFEDYMLKEIYEQPTAIRETIGAKLGEGSKCEFDELKFTKEYLKSLNKIYLVACGTAMHAGLAAKNMLERICKIPTEVDIASEFRYRDPIVDEKTLCIFISQSGETADTIAALKLSKEKGAKTLAISNVIGSSITREADYSIYTHAGPEIAVASTKAYTSQVVLLAILAIYFAETLELTDKNILELKNNILELPSKIEETLKCAEQIKEFGHRIYQEKDVFFLGRGIDETVAKESALKLKEISYIHADSYPAGELKHGPIALIENDITVISIMTDKNLVEKTVSNIQEVITRGAKTLVVTNQNIDDKMFDTVIHIPETNTFISPILSVIPLQLLAYYISKEKGLDVDKPRNLAKSVTVE